MVDRWHITNEFSDTLQTSLRSFKYIEDVYKRQIETNTNLVQIYGFIGKPEFAQKSALQYFFVNGRYMRHPYFHKSIMLAYNQMIQANESPNYFIYFEVDPQTIDINIHPTKTEIKFENEQALWSILSATVKEALGKFNIVPSIDFNQENACLLYTSRCV